MALALLGGDLKRRELLSARLGDVHSQLLIACAILKYHATLPRDEANDAHAHYALRRAFSLAHNSLEAFYRNFGFYGIGHVLKRLFFPFGRPCKAQAPGDEQIRTLGEMIMSPSSVRDALAQPAYIPSDPDDAIGRVEATYNKLLEVEPAWLAFLKADGKGQLDGNSVLEKLKDAASKGIISEDQVEAVNEYDAMRYAACSPMPSTKPEEGESTCRAANNVGP